AFGEYYYSVGFTFNEGEFGAFSSDGFKRWQLSAVNEPSLTKELDALNSPYLLLDLRENIAAISDKKSILYKEMPIRTDVSESFSEDNGGMMTIDLSNSYDCLIYIDKTSYPTTIEWKR
ncbi:MAG: erythromycin esterase family protein, partial [Bacteroidota bacterium]